MAKHRNGGLDTIRMKFIAHLGKFEDLDTFDSLFEFQSKMNPNKKDLDTNKLSNEDDFFDSLNDKDTDEDNPF